MNNSPETLKKKREKRAYWKKNTDPSSVKPFIIKICKRCGLNKPCRWATTFTQTGNPEYRANCFDCQKLYDKEKVPLYSSRRTEHARYKKRKVKLKCIAYLGGKCIKCGYSKCARSLTFHHRDRREKERSISQIKDWNWEKIKNELDKCDLLCFNCHMEIEDNYDAL